MKNLILLPLVTSLTTVAVADSHTVDETMIVTATRTKQTFAQTLPAVTVFTRADIEKLQANSLSELLSRAPGMSITRTGGRGSATGVSLRGNQTDHTLFLVDGVRIGSSTLGSTALENIDPELIERIEIVRGPKSSLYGSDALGGVVNVITRKANNQSPVIVKGSIGNNNSDQAVLSLGHKAANYQANLTASYEYSGGYDTTTATNTPNGDDDAFRSSSVGLNGRYEFSEAFNLGLSYQRSEGESEYDNNCTDNTTYLPVICSPYSDNLQEAMSLSSEWTVNRFWFTSLSFGLSKDESETLADEVDMSTTFSGGVFDTEKTTLNWQNDLSINKNTLLTIGYEFLKEEVSGTTDYDVSERDNDAVYLQLLLSLDKFSVNLGARNDDNEQFGSHDTYNIATGYQLNRDIKIVASFGQAFKAPTFNDLYYPNFGDPSMVPEETDAYEVTLKGIYARYNWTLSVYQNDVTNLIQYNPSIFANDQISSATIKGLELAAATEIMDWDLSAALTLLNTEDDQTGNELARRPEQTINIDLDREFGDWSLGATVYASSSRFNDAGNSSELSGFATVALRGAFQLNDEVKFQLKADNIFEKDYAITQSSSFQGLGDYKQPGLEVLFSVLYTPRF